jgi:hypothetical protein
MCPLRDVAIVADPAEPGFPRTSTFCSPTRVIPRRFPVQPGNPRVSGPFPYHGLLAFYLPVIIWSAYITLTTWYMLAELRRAPERSEITEPLGRT